jgi:polyhydroxyalkanoate synthesis repressor PhaR
VASFRPLKISPKSLIKTMGEATLMNSIENAQGANQGSNQGNSQVLNPAATQGMNQGVKQMNGKVKIIKRYQNRKLYDTQQSCYVTLDDIAKMIRINEEVMVIDNKSKNDITAATLTQIIFEAEKKASQYAPLFTLREIIQTGNGSISNYLAKLGAFPQDYMQRQAQAQAAQLERASTDSLKENLEQRVANAATRATADQTSKVAAEKATTLPGSDDNTPILPGASNTGFNN